MLKTLLKRLESSLDPATPDAIDATDKERVSALLLFEVARIDQDIDEAELATIRRAVASASRLPDTEIDEIVETAMADADSTVSLHAHIDLVNRHFDKAARLDLVEAMWRVAYADGDLDKYEEHTIRKLSDLLHVRHRDFIQAKLRVVES